MLFDIVFSKSRDVKNEVRKCIKKIVKVHAIMIRKM